MKKIVLLLLVVLAVASCKKTRQVQTFDLEKIAEQIDNIESKAQDNSVPLGPDGEPIPISYSTTIVDPETFTELTTISSDGSNFGLISRRGGLWRYIKGDTLKSWIETFATGGGGSLTVEEADGAPTLTATTLQFNQADGFVVTDEGSGQAQVDLNTIFTVAGESGSFTMEAGETVTFFGTDILVTASAQDVTFEFSNSVNFPGTEAIQLPDGTTAQRPGSPANGMLRYNTTTNKFEGYENSTWVDLAGGGSAPLDSTFITINIEDRGTSLPGTAGDIGYGFFTVPAYLDGWKIGYVGYSVFGAPSGGTYPLQMNKNGSTNVFAATIASGARYAEANGPYTLATGDYFKVTIPTTSGATTEPTGLQLHLILVR